MDAFEFENAHPLAQHSRSSTGDSSQTTPDVDNPAWKSPHSASICDRDLKKRLKNGFFNTEIDKLTQTSWRNASASAADHASHESPI